LGMPGGTTTRLTTFLRFLVRLCA